MSEIITLDCSVKHLQSRNSFHEVIADLDLAQGTLAVSREERHFCLETAFKKMPRLWADRVEWQYRSAKSCLRRLYALRVLYLSQFRTARSPQTRVLTPRVRKHHWECWLAGATSQLMKVADKSLGKMGVDGIFIITPLSKNLSAFNPWPLALIDSQALGTI